MPPLIEDPPYEKPVPPSPKKEGRFFVIIAGSYGRHGFGMYVQNFIAAQFPYRIIAILEISRPARLFVIERKLHQSIVHRGYTLCGL